jgi:TetR/AcrR family transcriptional regulator, regulator of biofilm formation and stress response
MQRTQARGDARRRSILDAVLAIVAREGVAGASHRAVAAEAGVSPAAVTYYFGSRADLLRAALDHFVDAEVARLGALAEGLAGLPPAVVAERFAAELGEHEPGLAQFELYLEAARDPALREAAARCLAAYEGVARSAIEAAGLEVDPVLVVALTDGIALRRLALGEGIDLGSLFLAVAQASNTRQDGEAAAGAKPGGGATTRWSRSRGSST